MRVAVAQLNLRLGDVEGNLARCLDAQSRASAAGAALLVLTECALSGYAFDSRDGALAAAVRLDGPELDSLAARSARLGLHTVVGFLETTGKALYNAAALLGPDGVLGHYRKCHLPYVGADRFVEIDEASRPRVISTRLGRIGLNICYDIRFPESARLLALAGADIIAQPTNWPSEAAILAEHFPVVRACENRVFFLVANRGDQENGETYIGMSQIVHPSGRILAQAKRGEDLLVADIEPADARQKRIVQQPGRYEVDLWASRRPELYGSLADNAPQHLSSDRDSLGRQQPASSLGRDRTG